MRKFEWYASAVVVILATLLVVTGAIWVSLSQHLERPSVSFRFPTIVPEGVYCPGSLIVYRQEMIISDAPAIIERVQSVWSIDEEQTVLFDDSPEWTSFSDVTMVRRVHDFKVPTLRPGAYELRVAVTGGYRWNTSLYRVRFTVPPGCES